MSDWRHWHDFNKHQNAHNRWVLTGYDDLYFERKERKNFSAKVGELILEVYWHQDGPKRGYEPPDSDQNFVMIIKTRRRRRGFHVMSLAKLATSTRSRLFYERQKRG